jgi:hypothetical protein
MEQVLTRGIGTWRWRRGECERSRRINMMQIMYTHVCKCKNISFETAPRIRGQGMKESSGEGEFKYDIFDAL